VATVVVLGVVTSLLLSAGVGDDRDNAAATAAGDDMPSSAWANTAVDVDEPDVETAESSVDDVDLVTWGDNVRYWRNERGLSQVQLAALARVTQTAISLLEAGRRRPSDPMKIAVARALDIPAPQLFPYPKDVR